MNFLWLLPIAITFICWGLWGFLPKFALRYMGPMDVMLHEVIGALAVGLGLLLWLGFKVKWHPTGSAFAIGAGMVNYIGILCYLYALRAGPVSITVVLTALYPILTIVLAYFFLGEVLTLKQLAGIGFAMVSVVLLVS